MTIVKDQHGNRLSLSKTRLTELKASICPCYLRLKDLPKSGEGTVVLYFRSSGQGIFPRPVSRTFGRIGCCLFSKTDFAKILKAAKAAQKAKR